MHDIADSLVGTSGGAGLSIEQRKRLTIGVELVAKPSVILFLDEPTSGLDGQAAFNTVRFLKKLAAAGQAILVTIHQPSSQLFAQFDNLLLLAKGGNTAYFGEIGMNASVIREYFGKHGAACPEGKNPAEHMIDVISDTTKNWNEIWLNSPERGAMLEELDGLQDPSQHTPKQNVDESLEFAMPLWDQIKIVSSRANRSMYRNVEYLNNKFAFHIIVGLFTGFSFWQVGTSVSDLQKRLFAVFNFIFVAPGVIGKFLSLLLLTRFLGTDIDVPYSTTPTPLHPKTRYLRHTRKEIQNVLVDRLCDFPHHIRVSLPRHLRSPVFRLLLLYGGIPC
jgi:ATP-binding cassette subfamily G (WHITE) protein 2 (SNQ2)